ncbi:hypothetical protein pEaSNUABM5_00224 [Erwinia phage pEa_SNUABM_5]|uniref:Uncharacterized protein n=1 Tax=Erwinia phage pEa_SNUABM_5 TaxID=2797313 RepID=A0A7T8EPL9_9CAUD|nr:hypothetical protein MPK73_gp224 [Erwinia phage pEa_SNUABM_5]QQO90366.1 hypothetical protein pEaSNUABM5_00224 [Erwinia phage pEa_SNUABM_5]
MAKTERPAKTADRVSSQSDNLADIESRYSRIGDFLYLYEHHRRKFPLEDYRTWPEISIAQALSILIDKEYTSKELDVMPADLLASYGRTKKFFDSYRAGTNLTDADIKLLFIQQKIDFGFAIPLLVELFGDVPPKDSSKVSFLYSWINCVRFMNKKVWLAEQNEIKLRDKDDPKAFEFEIECTLEQAAILEKYIAIKVDAYNHWWAYTINRFPKQKSKEAPLPTSTYITELRSAYLKHGLKIPRSLVSRALTSCAAHWQRWSDNTNKQGSRPDKLNPDAKNNTLSVSDSGFSFVESNTALSVGDAKKIHISNVIRGEINSDRKAKYLIVMRKEGLIYSVKGKYK